MTAANRHPWWDRVILAVDSPSVDDIWAWTHRFRTWVRWVKIGPVAFVAHGPALLRSLKESEWKIFLDLKFHDIPSVMARAVQVAHEHQVDMVNVHALSGPEALQAVAAARQELGATGLRILGVTLLTSHETAPWAPQADSAELVLNLARWVADAGLDGVVCSPREVSRIRQTFGDQLLTVTPGIRLQPPGDDQKRWTTPWDAFQRGADFIVMGRSLILGDADVCERINRSFWQADTV